MNKAIIAHDKKKELMVQFCIAYSGILAKHNLLATGVTGKMVAEATNLNVHRFYSCSQGGDQQIAARLQYNEIDMLLFFRDASSTSPEYGPDADLFRLCDIHNVPVSTNIATAEILVRALERGDLDWREFVNPRSQYNMSKKTPLY